MIFVLPYYAIRLLAVEELRRKCKRERALILTYDDGPGPRLTRAITGLLAANEAKATFFLLGRRVVQEPDAVDSLQRAGHELGTHSYDHCNAWKTIPSTAVSDINAGYGAVSRWVPPDGLFRPPNGKLSYVTWQALRKRGARVCWWTLDSGDTWPVLPSPQRTVDSIVRAGGGVVLMHDFDRGPEREAFVIKTTEILLASVKREGLNVMTMSDLFEPVSDNSAGAEDSGR